MLKKSRSLLKILIITTLFIKSTLASEYNFGYACKTNGHWTQAALQESNKLIKVLDALKNNENCQGMESIISDLMNAANNFQKSVKNSKGDSSDDNSIDGIDNNNIEGQKSFLNTAMRSDTSARGPNKGSFFDLLAGVHMTSIINDTLDFTKTFSAGFFNKAQVVKGLDRSAGELSDVVNRALTSFIGPKLDQCLVEAPAQGLVLISGMLRLVANTSVPVLSGGANRLGGTIANFVQYMRQSKFSKTIKKLKQNELWASITCALESSSESYCSTRDQIRLLKWGLASMSKTGVYANFDENNPPNGNFLTGYYTLNRNVPIIAKWLLKVQFGVEPKLITDATYKNSIWETVIGIISSINDLKAVFNEYRRNILHSTNKKTQRNMTFGLLSKIKMSMQSAVIQSGGSEINFYSNSLPMKYLALILVGMDEGDYPKDVLPKESGLIITSEEWLQNGGKYQPMFDDPIKLLEIVKINMEKIIESVQTEMRKFFIDRLIVDKMNLVAEAYTIDSMSTSVDDSIKIILRYLEGLRGRIKKSEFGDDQVIHLIDDTLIQLSEVTIALDNYGKSRGNEKKSQAAAEEVIEIVYEKFNVLIQRDSFVTNRMATIVHYDYFLQILENKDIGQYERDLMIISNNEAYQNLILAHAENPAVAKEDYQNALMINRRNIDAIESIFRNNFLTYLQSMKDDAGGMPVFLRNSRVLKHIFKDNVLALPKSIFGYKYRYQLELINPFNPPYKRGNIFSGGDNEDNSFLANKNRTCVQLLAAPKPSKVYWDFCKNSVVKSPFYLAAETENEKNKLQHLNASFKEFIRYKNKKSSDDKICAYRDYLRRNHVHWLTLQHEQIKDHKRKSIQKTTNANSILERARERLKLKVIKEREDLKAKLMAELKEAIFTLTKATKEAERNQKKIARRKENLKVLMDIMPEFEKLKEDREEILLLEDLQDELLDKIDTKKEKVKELKLQIKLLKSEIKNISSTLSHIFEL